MKLVRPRHEILGIYADFSTGDPLHMIELAGRVCYKSKSEMNHDTAKQFATMIQKRGHESVIEHSAITVKFTCDRGVTHELVRHRLCAFSQESTRYCNYANEKEISVIDPFFFDPMEERKWVAVPILMAYQGNDSTSQNSEYCMMNSFDVWFLTCLWTQWGYMTLINEFGRKAQEARSVLPNSTKTEIVVTANMREWRHILKLRCSKAAHPQMREVMLPLLKSLQEKVAVVFDDITF